MWDRDSTSEGQKNLNTGQKYDKEITTCKNWSQFDKFLAYRSFQNRRESCIRYLTSLKFKVNKFVPCLLRASTLILGCTYCPFPPWHPELFLNTWKSSIPSTAFRRHWCLLVTFTFVVILVYVGANFNIYSVFDLSKISFVLVYFYYLCK